MSALLHSMSVLGTRSQVVERAWWSYLVWIPAAAVLGYAIAAIFSGWLKLPSTATSGSSAQPNGKQTHAPAFLLPIFKLPLVLYRLRLGWLFGHRFMLLSHVGRKTGKVRQTILAVLSYDAGSREIKAVSAWNASEWYKNIQAAPAIAVETGVTRYAPVQRELSTEEIAQLFVDYCKNHPIFSRIVCQIPGWKWDSSYAEFLELAQTLRGVAFRPQSSSRTYLDNPRG